MEFSWTSSRKWWVCSDNCGILRYGIIPKKRCKSCLDFVSLIALAFSGSGEIPFPEFCVPRIFWSLQKHTYSYLISNLTFEFYLRLAPCECLIEFRRIPICWYHRGYSLPPHNPVLFPRCSVWKLHLHYSSHKVNA